MRHIIITAALLACAACQKETAPDSAAADWSADSAAITKLEQAQIAAISAKDAAGAAANYSDDAVFIDQNGSLARGGTAIGAIFQAIAGDPALSFDYQPGDKTFSDDGSMAYSTASFTESYTDPATKKVVTIKGTNLSVWKKQADGSWKLVADSNPATFAG